jgi:hypothetical protein
MISFVRRNGNYVSGIEKRLDMRCEKNAPTGAPAAFKPFINPEMPGTAGCGIEGNCLPAQKSRKQNQSKGQAARSRQFRYWQIVLALNCARRHAAGP